MQLMKEIETCLNVKGKIYDFLSISLYVLIRKVTDPVSFVSLVIEDKGIYKDTRESLCNELSVPLLYVEQIGIINTIIRKACESNDNRDHQLSILYSVLLGINDAAKEWSDNELTTWGPLDTDSRHRYRVYLRPHKTLIKEFECGVQRKRNKKTDELIDSLNSFVFLDVRELNIEKDQSIPVGKFVKPSDNNWKEGKLRIGIAPLCCDQNFKFAFTPVSDKIQKAHVEYTPEPEQLPFAIRTRKILEKASKYGCNIVVFPEFTCSNQQHDAIKDTLDALNKKNSPVPDLIFAGTTWTSNNENVLTVYNSQGTAIGHYYKHDCYDNTDGKTKIRTIEDIKNPWKIVDFYGLPGIGFIMPVICKDAMVEDGPADLFSKLFSPLLIVIPAWSPSVSSFNRLVTNSKDNFTSFILADACSAVHDEGEFSVGMSIIVNKEGSTVNGIPKEITAEGCDRTLCDDGCLAVLEYDFFFESGDKKEDPPKHNTSVTRIV